MCVPSAALQALVPTVDNTMTVECPNDAIPSHDVTETNVFKRPSMAFIVEAHNLSDLKFAMKQAVRKSACRSYALQVNTLSIGVKFIFSRCFTVKLYRCFLT